MFTESIFLRRVWESDKKTLVRDLQFVGEYPKDYNVSVSMIQISFVLNITQINLKAIHGSYFFNQ